MFVMIQNQWKIKCISSVFTLLLFIILFWLINHITDYKGRNKLFTYKWQSNILQESCFALKCGSPDPVLSLTLSDLFAENQNRVGSAFGRVLTCFAVALDRRPLGVGVQRRDGDGVGRVRDQAVQVGVGDASRNQNLPGPEKKQNQEMRSSSARSSRNNRSGPA